MKNDNIQSLLTSLEHELTGEKKMILENMESWSLLKNSVIEVE